MEEFEKTQKRRAKNTVGASGYHYAAFCGIIIVNFNGRVLLEKCLSSIANMNYSKFNVYVIENGSSDGSVEFVKTLFPQFNFVSLGANLGPQSE